MPNNDPYNNYNNAASPPHLFVRVITSPGHDYAFDTPLGNALTMYMLLPTFLIGVALNSSLVATFIYARRKLITMRLDRIVFSLLIVSIFWAGSMLRKYLHRLISPGDIGMTFTGFLNTFNLILVFGINLLLAVERFFVFRNTDSTASRPYFAIVFVIMLLQFIITLWLFTSSTSTNGVVPDLPLQSLVWTITVAVSFAGQNLAITILYWRTYKSATQDLIKCANDEVNTARLLVRRKVLIYCILMASMLILLYLPTVIWHIIKGLSLELTGNSTVVVVVDRLVTEILALDVLVTPGLVLYFNMDARRELLYILRFRKRDGVHVLQDV
ncbi:hypothetical protein HDU81_007493 [Chytriomyces hyalinus]|nr:hypothetical protein HDU81_007493 [Chytriomyces hyalinus]